MLPAPHLQSRTAKIMAAVALGLAALALAAVAVAPQHATQVTSFLPSLPSLLHCVGRWTGDSPSHGTIPRRCRLMMMMMMIR